MSAGPTKVVIVGRDAALWLSANVLHAALAPAGVEIAAIELPTLLATADVYASLPPLEALHNQLRIGEAALLRATDGCFTLGQNFVDTRGIMPPFLHAYGAYGTAIDGQDFFGFWVKARALGLQVALEDFSLTAAAARQGRLLIPDDETERYGRSDYGYHLPAAAYARSLKTLTVKDGIAAFSASEIAVERDPTSGDIIAISFHGERVEGQLFVDATASEGLLIGGALGVESHDWRSFFPADRALIASGPAFQSLPAYAEIRAWEHGWAGLYPSQKHTHIVQAYALADEDLVIRKLPVICGFALESAAVRVLEPGRREQIWAHNCVAIGAAACRFDPIHNVDLHAIQLGLVNLLSHFPAGGDCAAQRTEYGRIMQSAFERIRDFQSAYYALAPYGDGAFWARARGGEVSLALAHGIALFAARGEIAPMEDESFAPDSWRAMFVGMGLTPASYLPTIDRISPDRIKAQFRNMLGFVREHVLRQPTHNDTLQKQRGHG